jgi:cardiolipin synthase
MIKKIQALWAQLPAHEKRMTVPTILTLARIGLTIVIMYYIKIHYWGVAWALFAAAALTDVLDGSLARLYHEKTFLGACLDPLADKFLILSVFFTLTFTQTPLFHIPLWFACIVLLKELILIGGSFIIYISTSDLMINPTWLGKVSMALQSVFIVWVFACYFFKWVPLKTHYTMLGIIVLCAIASLIQYVCIGMMLSYQINGKNSAVK